MNPVQSPGPREESELPDPADALSPETAGLREQHSSQNPLQQPDASGGRITLEKPPQRLLAEEMGR